MKNILIIIAHPKQDSLSFSIMKKYKEAKENSGNIVKVVDLYRENNQQGFFTYDDANCVKTTEMSYFQDKISKADELVFIFPYWWGSYPAILHNFIDWNFSKGFAFEYVNSRPKGLLTNKKVTIFTTTGAPSFIYMITGANRRLKNTIKSQVINFCGMSLSSFNIYGGVNNNSKNIDKILNNVTKIAMVN